MVDIGAGTTDVAIWHDNALVHSAVLPFGGTHITSDVAFGLRTPRGEAEIIKCKHGCATVHLVDEDDIIEVASVGGRPAKEQSRQFLAEIIEPRVAEILEHVRDEVRKSGYHELLASGAVITGGSANLEGLTFMAEEIFDMPVRVGQPTRVSGLKDMVTDPSFAVAVGLVKHGYSSSELIPLDAYRRSRSRAGVFTWLGGAMKRLGSIFF
jgi:cell division protein FtsA